MNSDKSTKLEKQLNGLLTDFNLLKNKLNSQENIIEIIHRTFREIHNIKSNLFLIDKNKSLEMTYFVEELFEKLRSGENSLTEESLNIYIKCIEWIRIDISDGSAPEDRFKKLIRELKQLKTTTGQKETGQIKLKLNSDEKSLLRDARNSGLNIFIIESKIKGSISSEEYRDLPIIKQINEMGMIVLQTPAFKNIPAVSSGDPILLKVIFVTDRELNSLSDTLLKSALPFEDDLFLSSRDYKILIVEDNPVALLLQRSIMSAFGVCDTVTEGQTALELFKLALKEQSPYDLILLDLVMPGIGGSDVLKGIRELEELNGIKGLDRSKVIVNTTTKESSVLMDLFRAETDAYIIKPLTREKIENELKNLKMI